MFSKDTGSGAANGLPTLLIGEINLNMQADDDAAVNLMMGLKSTQRSV